MPDNLNDAASTDGTASPRLAVLIVSYNAAELLRDCLRSLIASLADDPMADAKICVVDNASTSFDAGVLRDEFPQVELLLLEENRGFAGGNNAGWNWLRTRYPLLEYVVLLNQDTLVNGRWLSPLRERLEHEPQLAAVQPLILLHPETDRINTQGNRCHFLGFGLMDGYREAASTVPNAPREIASASGAAVLLRISALEEGELFDERYFLYLEDTELAWKLRLRGYRIELVPTSRVYHRFEFQAPYRRYGLLERNRWWLLLTYYRWRTLLLLSPAILLMECGQWVFALQHGLLRQRLWALYELVRPGNWAPQLRARRLAQKARRVTDRELTSTFTGTFDAALLPGVLVQRIANPVFSSYWNGVRRVIRW